MDIYYLKDHMFEEFDDAKEYMYHAENLKGVNNEWSKYFYDMAKAEVDHATNFYKMFDQHYKSLDTKPELSAYMEPFKLDMDKCYMEKMSKIRYMMETYSR